jgi:hypothetical protein
MYQPNNSYVAFSASGSQNAQPNVKQEEKALIQSTYEGNNPGHNTAVRWEPEVATQYEEDRGNEDEDQDVDGYDAISDRGYA